MKGLQSVAKLKAGLLEPCMSPYNTPTLLVIVQDLRIVGETIKPRHSTFLHPCTILSWVPSSHWCYSVLDLRDAFWGCPLTEHSKQYFAFQWEQLGKEVKLHHP